ncbi:MAG TPA: hypothetical protein PKA05_00395 [Roseiflexaceae bacterium]|nr:hypothetical protein [Roseiflexaceae bacterium]HMP38814.1 hypothetical protein [Roseiflexaceae bacterium]
MGLRPATTFLRLALRRAARGTGSTPEFFERRTAVQALPALHQILGSIPWVLVGGIALRAYIPERMTLDVYILVHQRDEERVRAAFLAAGYRVTGLLSIGGLSVQSVQASEPPIDVLTRADVWLDDALAELVHDSAGYPVLGRSFLILLKLQAGRTQDLADVQRLVAHTSAEERTAYLQLIRRESPELIEDLESLYTLADLEFGNRAQEG